MRNWLCDPLKSWTILKFFYQCPKNMLKHFKRPPTLCRSNPDGVGVAPHCITSRTVLVSCISTKIRCRVLKAEMKNQKVRTCNHSVCPLVGVGTLPTPLSPARVPLPPEPGGGGHTRLRVKGLGES